MFNRRLLIAFLCGSSAIAVAQDAAAWGRLRRHRCQCWCAERSAVYGPSEAEQAFQKPQPQLSDKADDRLPSPYYITDDSQYFPPGPEYKLQREEAVRQSSTLKVAPNNQEARPPVQAKAQPLAQPAAKPAPVAPTVLELILDAVLRDVMSNPDLKDERESYGVPGDKHVGLVSNPEYGVLWPKNYSPRLEGFTFHRVREDEVDEASDEKPKMLGVRIDKLDLQQRQSGLMNTPIKITILNGGGTKDGIIQGGCSVYYIPKQKGDSWVVEFSGALDP